jgi:hypothetical protein
MLEHGASTIYSSDFSFNRLLQSDGAGRVVAQERVVDNIKDADAIGAAGGGLVGTVILPAVGTTAGAAAAGGGASLGVAIVSLIEWFF